MDSVSAFRKHYAVFPDNEFTYFEFGRRAFGKENRIRDELEKIDVRFSAIIQYDDRDFGINGTLVTFKIVNDV